MRTLLFVFLLFAAPAGAQDTQGTPPSAIQQHLFTNQAEDMIRRALKDPDSAQFSWPNGFVQGVYKSEIIGSPFTAFEQKYPGWITCGTVNAKNGYGGYDGPTPVIVVGTQWGVSAVDMDEPSDRFHYVIEACRKLGF